MCILNNCVYIHSEFQEELSTKWAEMAAEISQLLATELGLQEHEQPLPFDATLEKSIDEQR